MFNQAEAPLQNRSHAVLGDALFDLSGVAPQFVPVIELPPYVSALQAQIDGLTARVVELERARLVPTRWARIWAWVRRYWWAI